MLRKTTAKKGTVPEAAQARKEKKSSGSEYEAPKLTKFEKLEKLIVSGE